MSAFETNRPRTQLFAFTLFPVIIRRKSLGHGYFLTNVNDFNLSVMVVGIKGKKINIVVGIKEMSISIVYKIGTSCKKCVTLPCVVSNSSTFNFL